MGVFKRLVALFRPTRASGEVRLPPWLDVTEPEAVARHEARMAAAREAGRLGWARTRRERG